MPPAVLRLLILHTCLLGVACSGAEQPNEPGRIPAVEAQYLLGTHLCRIPQPPRAELLADMELLKKKGFNLVKIQTHWATDEIVEGHYDFFAYEFLVEKAQQLGMYVYIGLTCEQAPAWLYRKFPDCRMVGRNGVPIIYGVFRIGG